MFKSVLLSRANFTKEKRSQICEALQKVICTLKETLTQKMVKDGYASIGQCPINFDVAMSKCTRDISKTDIEVMKEKLPDVVQKFRMNGIVTEQDMDEAGIMNIDSDRKTPKDQRVLHQQRAVLMNSAECIAKYKLYRTEKETNTARTAEKRTDRTKYNFHKARYQLWYLELSTSAKTQENKKRKEKFKASQGESIRGSKKEMKLK
jgi:hypothetical protein